MRPALEDNPYLASNLVEIGHSARDAMEAVRERLFHLQPLPLAPITVRHCVEDALAASQLPAGLPWT